VKAGTLANRMANPGEHISGRSTADITPDMMIAAHAELLSLVDQRFPERFYKGEGHWRLLGHALIARIAGLVRSICALTATGQQADSLILLRTLYDHVLMFCWLAINPEERVYEWRDHAVVQRRKLHNDATLFGMRILSADELEEAAELVEFEHGPIQRADEVDAYWSARVAGFRPPTKGRQEGLLTMRGLYTGIYRSASRIAHAQIETVYDCMDIRHYPRRPAIVHAERDESMRWSSFSVPLFAMALLVCHARFGWPDDDVVRQINDGLVRESPDSDGAA